MEKREPVCENLFPKIKNYVCLLILDHSSEFVLFGSISEKNTTMVMIRLWHKAAEISQAL